jgi:hypothetical protein
MKKTFLWAVVSAIGFVCQANADTWSFDYSGAGVSAAGTVTTGAAVTTFEGNAGYVITGITGQRNGSAITGLVADNVDPAVGYSSGFGFWYNNVLLASGGFDYWGLLFTAADGGTYNLYNSGGQYLDAFYAPSGSPVITPVSAHVPDGGATVAMLGGVLVGFAMLRRRLVG